MSPKRGGINRSKIDFDRSEHPRRLGDDTKISFKPPKTPKTRSFEQAKDPAGYTTIIPFKWMLKAPATLVIQSIIVQNKRHGRPDLPRFFEFASCFFIRSAQRNADFGEIHNTHARTNPYVTTTK